MGEDEADEATADDDCEVIVNMPEVDVGGALELSVAALPDVAGCESVGVGVKVGVVGVGEREDSGSVDEEGDAAPDDREMDKMDPGMAERELVVPGEEVVWEGGGGKVGMMGPPGTGMSGGVAVAISYSVVDCVRAGGGRSAIEM